LRRGSEAEDSRVTGPGGPGPLAERLRPGEEVSALGEEVLSLARDAHSTADAIEEPDAEILLELADLAPEGRLTHPKLRRSLRETSRVSDGDEVAEVPEIHDQSCL